ncbi:hypothetical protein AAC387_Pa03g4506 [Persea americana]
MTLTRNVSDITTSDSKKRKRVVFANIDAGIEANECIRVFLVSCPEEMDTADCFSTNPVDLCHFFGEEGKIYGYNDLKINIWISCVSFHAYADVTFHSTFNGSKGITDLNPIIQDICGESLVENKDEFLKTFSTEAQFFRNIISNGEVICSEASKGHDDASYSHLEPEASITEVVRMNLSNVPVGQLYDRLVALVHLFVDGGSPVDVTDPKWEIHFIIERNTDLGVETYFKLLGFATIYHFYHYPDSSRLRLGQILVLPPNQGRGHGRHLLEALNSVAISENAYDVTVEDPSDYLQHVRTCIDTLRLLKFDPIKSAISSTASQLKQGRLSKKTCELRSNPPARVVDKVRQQLKINKKQFLRCWEVLVYLNLDPTDCHSMENYRASILDRMKVDVLGKDVGTAGKCVVEVPDDHDMTFVMFRSQAGGTDCTLDFEVDKDRKSQEEQLNHLLDKRMKEIFKIAEKVSLHCSSEAKL